MNKAIAGVFIGTVLIIGGLLWAGQPGDSQGDQAAQASVLVSQEEIFDFGSISMANGKVNHEFSITNGSDQEVTIKKIYTSCMCTEANFRLGDTTYGLFGMPGHGSSAQTAANISLGAGQSAILDVIYDPNAHGPAGVGPVDRFVYVEDKEGGQLTVEIKAVVTP